MDSECAELLDENRYAPQALPAGFCLGHELATGNILALANIHITLVPILPQPPDGLHSPRNILQRQRLLGKPRALGQS